MKFNLDKIVNIKTKKDLIDFNHDKDKPIFYNNFLFHYLIILDKLDLLKLDEHPIYKLNEDGLDGFMLAAKYDNISILKYLLKKYPDYAQNHNKEGLHFINFFKNPNKLISIMKEFPKIDWYYLFKFKNESSIDFFSFFISMLEFENLNWFLSQYKNFTTIYVLKAIVLNETITDVQKKKIFDKFSNEEINSKDYENIGLILTLINLEDYNLIEYFLTKKIDLEYILKPITHFITPIYFILSKLSLGNNAKLEKILELIWEWIDIDLNFIDKNGDTYTTFVLTLSNKNTSSIYKKIIMWILKNSPHSNWNKVNVNKENSLFYLINKPFKEYSPLIKNIKLDTKLKNRNNKDIFDILNENYEASKNKDFLKWKELLEKSKPSITEENINIDLEVHKYQHFTKFTATMIDIIIYFIHLSKKYKNLYIPKIYGNNSDRKDFPFIVNYDDNLKILDINPKLNVLINDIRREKSYDYALLFLSLTLENDLKHASILLYDFNNLTLERFETYGNDGIDNKMDDYIEEELTWNTGFKYLRPNDYLPKPSYQALSYEGNESLKAGDFGGFCLGWCIWYVEHRLKNPKIEPKILNQKTLEKLLRLDDTLTEFIRNYSNKLFDCKLKIVKNICPNNECINEKNISNLYMTKEDEDKIINFAKDFFS
jgi:hypothetical protein